MDIDDADMPIKPPISHYETKAKKQGQVCNSPCLDPTKWLKWLSDYYLLHIAQNTIYDIYKVTFI